MVLLFGLLFVSWFILGAVRLRTQDRILAANWDQLPENLQNQVAKLRKWHMNSAIGMIVLLTVDIILALTGNVPTGASQ